MTNHLKSVILTVILLAGIPSTDALPQDSQYFLHTVTQGQGLYSISRMYGVSEEDIIKANPGSETVIRIGEELRIPRSQKSNSIRLKRVRLSTDFQSRITYR